MAPGRWNAPKTPAITARGNRLAGTVAARDPDLIRSPEKSTHYAPAIALHPGAIPPP